MTKKKEVTKVEKKTEEKSKLDVTLKILAYLIPAMILLWVVYLNWLPFGYSDTLVIDVGSMDDTSGEFRLIESSSLGSRQEVDGVSFRYVDGIVQAVYSPKIPLRNATINVTLEGENVYFVSPPSVDSINWDYDFTLSDFIVEAPQSLYSEFLNNGLYMNYDTIGVINAEYNIEQTEKSILVGNVISWDIPDFFLGEEHEIVIGEANGHVYLFVDGEFKAKEKGSLGLQSVNKQEFVQVDSNGCWEFDGNTRLIYPNSSDMFEEGPFTVYVEWIAEKAQDRQQLIGHYNWEIYQNSDSITFTVGRMENSAGNFYSVNKEVNNDFFGKKHELLAVYSPSNEGYIELFVDGEFAGRTDLLNERIWQDYNGDKDLSLGWNTHNYGNNPYLESKVCDFKISNNDLDLEKYTNYIKKSSSEEAISIQGQGNLYAIHLEVSE